MANKNKTDIITSIAKKTNLSCKQISEILTSFFEYIIENNINGNVVKINKFGTFYLQNFSYDKNQYDFITKKNEKFIGTRKNIQFRMSKHLKNNLNYNIDDMI